MIRKTKLSGNWQLGYCKNDKAISAVTASDIEKAGYSVIPATVPGNFELDFQRAGLIDEPFFGENVLGLTKFEDTHLYYTTTFQYKNRDKTPYLLFEGIDTFAEIYLNGSFLGTTDNMLIEHRLPATSVKDGENELLVHILPTQIKARELPSTPFDGAATFNYGGLHVRKAPHMYGWDIMPRIVSGGIWRDVYLEEYPADYIEESYLFTASAGENADSKVFLYYRLNLEDGDLSKYTLKVQGRCGESNFEHTERLWFTAGKWAFNIENSKLWWPKGSGEQNLYDVRLTLCRDGEEADIKEFKFGLRVAGLKRRSATVDDKGVFDVVVNGKKIFIHGTNWVPADAFHSRDKERIPAMLQMADDLNCNMIRCWGGNVYECDEFYELCDQLGILIWQDFSMGCAAYPRDKEFCAALEKEAVAVVKRLRQHACLYMWAGDNENDLVNMDGWYGLGGNPQFNILTREILPAVVRAQDPARDYLPSSPYVSEDYERGKSRMVEDHLWGPRDYYKSPFYTTQNNPRFVSETGYHGSVSPESAAKFLSPDAIWPMGNREWLTHAASMDPRACGYDYRIGLMKRQVENLFADFPDNFPDFAAASQICEAEALKFYVEKFRIRRNTRGGILWWNLIDGWPQFSDSVVDYYFCKKQAYFHLKTSQLPLCLMLDEPENGSLKLFAVSDLLDDTKITFNVKDAQSGKTVAEGSADVKGEYSQSIAEIPFAQGKKGVYIITWKLGDKEYKNHYIYGTPTFSLGGLLDVFKAENIWQAEGF